MTEFIWLFAGLFLGVCITLLAVCCLLLITSHADLTLLGRTKQKPPERKEE